MRTHLETADHLMEKQWYHDILHPSRMDMSREFILNVCNYETVYRLAAGIREIQPSSKNNRGMICVCTDNKILLTAALVAALSGGPRLVLPYAFSRQVIEEVLEILPLSFIIADAPDDFPAGIDVITPEMLSEDAILPADIRDPDDTFLMLFTGGSTGKPKAWSKTARNILTEAHFLANKFCINPKDLFLSTVPPRHIYGLLYSIVIPFISRARVLDRIYTFPREIFRSLQDYGASILISVPAHYRVLKNDDLQRYNLRVAFSSTGVLDKEDASYFHLKTGVDITEIYGSTETGGIAIRKLSTDGELWSSLKPVTCNIRGERLHVRSPFISQTLIVDRDGFFATADRADEEGDHRFILRGRSDDIVKIGGKRVDLAVVRSKLKQIPGVRDAVVISIPYGKGRQNELAAIVATHLDAHHLRRHMTAVSEPYAVPRRIAVVQEIPVLSTGKYDRESIEQILRIDVAP